MKKIFIPLIAVLFLACENDQNTSVASPDSISENANNSDFESNTGNTFKVSGGDNNDHSSSQSSQPYAQRKIIWNALLEFEVQDIETSTEHIRKVAEKHHAFISSMNLSSTYHHINNKITLKVENQYFQKLLTDIKGTSIHLVKAEVNSNDVTEDFIDIKSRLATKKEVRDRYIAILRNNTGSIEEVLKAEEAIRNITEEIEVQEGRLRYLSEKVAYATIDIEMYQKVPEGRVPKVEETNYVGQLKDGVIRGWDFIANFILFIVNLWPLFLIITLVIWKRKWIFKKLKF